MNHSQGLLLAAGGEDPQNVGVMRGSLEIRVSAVDPLRPRPRGLRSRPGIIGNPRFLGVRMLRANLGDEYVDALFRVYSGRVSHEADLVVYRHEKARAMIQAGRVKRVGLLATQDIRGGANQRVLERIKETGDIFMAWSDSAPRCHFLSTVRDSRALSPIRLIPSVRP
jgi:hypothetical protein